jgi:hypothetical protein
MARFAEPLTGSGNNETWPMQAVKNRRRYIMKARQGLVSEQSSRTAKPSSSTLAKDCGSNQKPRPSVRRHRTLGTINRLGELFVQALREGLLGDGAEDDVDAESEETV